jgi:hypothetical protein
MPRTERFSERIGAVFIPQADRARVVDARSTDAAGAPPGGEPCSTVLKDGCYTLALVPDGVPPAGIRYRGTLRVETLPTGLRFSGDLYRHHLLDRLITDPLGERAPPSDQAADTGGVIPIYPRRDYHAYLRGIEAVLTSVAPRGAGCPFTLEFEEFTYSHVDVGFHGRFQLIEVEAVAAIASFQPMTATA